MEFHIKLKALIAACRISGSEIARGIGMDPSYFHKFLRGEREPNLELVLKLARYFHVSVEYLADDSMDEPPPELSAEQQWVLARLAELGFPRTRNRLLNIPDEEPGQLGSSASGFSIQAGTPGSDVRGRETKRKNG